MSDSTVGPLSIRRARVLVSVAIALAIALATGSVALGADTFRFHGSGYGHGIGMSQWGAYGLAQDGWSYPRILTHFYSGTRVERASIPPRRVRVGLTSGRSTIRLGAKAGSVRLWLDGPGRTFVARIPRGKTWTVSAAPTRRRYAIRDHTGALVGGVRWGGPSRPLFVTYQDAGARVFVPEADEIWHAGYTYAYGFLEFDLLRCADRCVQRLTIELPFERYFRGLGEMPSSWPAAALRAQVVAARTFAIYKIRRHGLRSDCDCHLEDGAGDQVYVGWGKEVGPDGDRWVAAVVATAGEVVTYRDSVIQAFYAASDGGFSEDVEDVWHGGNPAYAIPYLRGVCDPGEYTSANPWTDWTRSFSASTLSARLGPYTGGIGTIKGFSDTRRGVSGRIVSALARGTGGTARVSGAELRSALGLPDRRVWVNRDHNIVGALRAKYDALMCRPGTAASRVLVVDHGSRQLFERGGLYRNGRVDLTVWLRGSIHREYLAVGGAPGRLGLPVGPAARTTRTFATTTCSGCRRLVLEGGRIYSKPGLGAHALWGPVLSTYLGRGGAQGALGYPTTRVRREDVGVRASFEHGTIACAGGSCSVQLG
ncbi:MAG TPA: SpoIID/LytB domain-containing protein [Actinomycetota bacterium]|nr:SpoIID/LytB domain-containing protein [Actinomycetota bacterium]